MAKTGYSRAERVADQIRMEVADILMRKNQGSARPVSDRDRCGIDQRSADRPSVRDSAWVRRRKRRMSLPG